MYVRKLKFWSKVTPKFLGDVDGFVSLLIRVILETRISTFGVVFHDRLEGIQSCMG